MDTRAAKGNKAAGDAWVLYAADETADDPAQAGAFAMDAGAEAGTDIGDLARHKNAGLRAGAEAVPLPPTVDFVEDFPESAILESASPESPPDGIDGQSTLWGKAPQDLPSAADAFGAAATADKGERPDRPALASEAFAVFDDPDGGSPSPLPIPKASGRFPFGITERPARENLSIKNRIAAAFGDKTMWANLGPVLVFALLLYSMVYVMVERPYIMLLDGKPIAFVKNKENGQKLLEQANLEMSAPYSAESNFRQYAEIDFTRDGVEIKTKTTDEKLVLDRLKTDITWFIDAWTIAVGHERTVYLASRAQAEQVLENVKKSYLPESDELTILSAEFVEPIELIMEEIQIHHLGDPEQAFRTLTEGREPLREYRVQRNDSYWSIAERNNMTVDELKTINDARNDNLAVGQVLKLNVPKPLLSVRTTVSAVMQEDIPFGTVYRTNSEAWEGQSRVLKNGEAGVLEVAYEISRVNGVTVAQVVLSETVVSAPVDRIVENGTKAIVASRAVALDLEGGALVWPIRAKVNSPFGPRSRGFHSGIDIQASTGDPVYSAGAGKVTSASFFAGYGNQVTIDHGEGLSTMYAHLSKINVSVGQMVGMQELVGLAGATGRTTGPHLHFEVRIDGSPQNPVNYLN